MKAENEDRLHPVAKRRGGPFITLFVAIAALAALMLFWLWGNQQDPQETPTDTAAAAPAITAPKLKTRAAPDIPKPRPPAKTVIAQSSTTSEEPEPTTQALPTPDESDDILLQQLELTGADNILPALAQTEHPLEVTAALLDGLGRGMLLRKLLPAEPPKAAFKATKTGGSMFMDTASYQRYDSYAAAIAALDPDTVVASFHTLRPLYERAYGVLGLEPDDFDNAVIRSLDLVLATPEIGEPIELQRKSVMYLYADPELEALPSLQKQLMRMGPENIRLIKQRAQLLRDALLTQ